MVQAKRKPKSHITYSRECKKMWGSEPSHSQGQLPLRDFRERFEGSKLNGLWCSYIIGNLLQHRCLKWVRIVHLDIWNTSYGQKKGRESNCQFDSRLENVGNQPNLLVFRRCATNPWKTLDKSYNFALDRTLIQGLLAKLWGSKVMRIPIGAILGLPFGSPGREKSFGCRPRGDV